MSAAWLRAENASLRFPLYHAGARSLKKTLLGAAASGIGTRLGRADSGQLFVQALHDLTFAIASGERVGLIGGNGAGKTSLLRLLAGIYRPAQGRVLSHGRIQALLHPGQGMNPDLTGRENVRLGGLYHGLSRPALRRLEEDVAEFAALGDFLNLPLRIYSAGMAVRLGFALATAMRPEILLMDEWFLAGDAAFMEKARTRLEDMVRGAEIFIVATHQSDVLREWTTRAVWLQQGRIRQDGPTNTTLAAYHPVEPLPFAG